jgi:hypothetical protein
MEPALRAGPGIDPLRESVGNPNNRDLLIEISHQLRLEVERKNGATAAVSANS